MVVFQKVESVKTEFINDEFIGKLLLLSLWAYSNLLAGRLASTN